MSSIPINEIYQHKLNFIIGAGASSGLFPTLWLAVKDSDKQESEETVETLATKLDNLGESYKQHHTLLFMYYYQKIIKPVCNFKLSSLKKTHTNCSIDDCKVCQEEDRRSEVIKNYRIFIDSVVRLLQEKKQFERRCNLFTTNYDGCVQLVADELIKEGNLEFCVNDGASGFLDRTLSARNFKNYLCQSGVFGRNSSDVPQINFINLHGSAYWRKAGDRIKVNYSTSETDIQIPKVATQYLDKLGKILNDPSKTTQDIIALKVDLPQDVIDAFWDAYDKLPIVNPTKWKFHETVFEEHYYQMLRLLSYQLEEPNSVLVSFAFSFADEHILNLVKRSLANRKLKVFVCCFNDKELKAMTERFKRDKNVELISLENEELNFTKFNAEIFNADMLRDTEQ